MNNINQMFSELSKHGYFLCWDGMEWSFGNEYLEDEEFLLDGVRGVDKDEVIRLGYEKLKL